MPPRTLPPTKKVKTFVLDHLVKDRAQMSSAKEFFDTEGILIFDLGCRIVPKVIVYHFLQYIFDHLPYKKEFRLQLKSEAGKLLHIDNKKDWPELVDALLAPSFSKENRDRMRKWGIPHTDFGASCEVGSFWNPTLMELRQDEDIHKLAEYLMSRDSDSNGDKPRLVSDLNRSINVLPGAGKAEFLHTDGSPFDLPASNACAEEPRKGVSGKVVYAGSQTFSYVPGSHTPEFFAEFTSKYERPEKHVPMYPIREDADPMNLFGKQVTVEVPPGFMIFWAQNVHGVLSRPNSVGIGFGGYLGFMPCLSAQQCAERYQDYLKGTKPKLWPSGGKIHGLPLKCQNFPKMMMLAFGNRLTPEATAQYLTTRETKTKPPKTVQHLNHWGFREGFYRPHEMFEITEQGKYILGFEQWPEQLVQPAGGSRALGGASQKRPLLLVKPVGGSRALGGASQKRPFPHEAGSASGSGAKKAAGASKQVPGASSSRDNAIIIISSDDEADDGLDGDDDADDGLDGDDDADDDDADDDDADKTESDDDQTTCTKSLECYDAACRAWISYVADQFADWQAGEFPYLALHNLSPVAAEKLKLCNVGKFWELAKIVNDGWDEENTGTMEAWSAKFASLL